MKMISFLVLYYPIHEMVLKLSGTSGAALFALRQAPDLMILCSFVVVLAARVNQGRVWMDPIGILTPVVILIGYSIILAALINPAGLVYAASELFVLLRYILVYCIIAMLRPSYDEILMILRLIMLSALIQLAIGLMQYFGGQGIIEVFRPIDYESTLTGIERSFTTNREVTRRILIGTAGEFISYGYILSFGVILAATIYRKHRWSLAFLTTLLLVLFLAGSRTIFLGTVSVLILLFLFEGSVKWRVGLGLFVGLLSIPLIEIMASFAAQSEYSYSNFLAIFDARILEALLNQRLGVITYVLPQYVSSGDFLFGYSPNRFFIEEIIHRHYPDVPPVLFAVFPQVVEDFYFGALLLYYGLVGFVLILVVGMKMAAMCVFNSRRAYAEVGAAGIASLFALVVFNLGNQALENRSFSFYFWVVMGINATVYVREGIKHAYPART